ncbi:hypothetical protein FPY71_07245 [Aureimonas fodinaquatilis]|uniref:Uncharacterized protein n=2 Tax=Aureimonas fodinaquatilis TaxID=2565783 RepID=A0A5B0DWD3_9HYPH|nr:hypothetical protein [Aureimonas fodinaquatilis]KAA0970312.1 hypothetical protein FPY71_07245 [Aureimonas fodinaquatilis]
MTTGPIPAASIERWSFGMGDDDAECFRVAIRCMDREYLAFAALPEDQRPQAKNRDMTPELFDALFA